MARPRLKTTHPRLGDDAGRQPVTALSGVGPALARSLARLGLERVQDLWFHLPLRYEDRTRVVPIADLRIGDRVQIEGLVDAVESGFRFRPQLKVTIAGDDGRMLLLRFFHFRRAQVEQFRVGMRLRCFGEVRQGMTGAEMVHPQYTRIASAHSALEASLTPVYPGTEGLGQKRLATLVKRSLDMLPATDRLELIPAPLLQPADFMSLREALLTVHRPPPDADLVALAQGRHAAQQRLALEELLAQHLSMQRARHRVRSHRAWVCNGEKRMSARLLQTLPFALTAAQQRVSAEIGRDMHQPRPMLRLVQGDVGSGKTVVAALAALQAIGSGCQVALVAPTELLAEQHLRSFRTWFEPLGLEVTWLAGKVQGRKRSAALQAVAHGAPLVIGTHALMQEAVTFERLGLAIIDEQHRFGVHQRLTLRDKGRSEGIVPHQLVLTATPIPRTLAMSAYADLDVSSIDELPPGRKPVRTAAVSAARRDEIVQRIRVACTEGRQAYWVCTLIEESDQLQAQAAEAAYAELAEALRGQSVALVHGRMKAREKQAAMDAFKAGTVQVLVATTVIEVGVDVPNASLMVIENAERLGLAQLHQLRGRVGRGAVASSCVLMYRPPLSATAQARLRVMRETSDGFRIAEEDLRLRGPGEVLGTRQTGQLSFRVADLARDAHLLPLVHRIGEDMLREHAERADHLMQRWIGGAARYVDA